MFQKRFAVRAAKKRVATFILENRVQNLRYPQTTKSHAVKPLYDIRILGLFSLSQVLRANSNQLHSKNLEDWSYQII